MTVKELMGLLSHQPPDRRVFLYDSILRTPRFVERWAAPTYSCASEVEYASTSVVNDKGGIIALVIE